MKSFYSIIFALGCLCSSTSYGMEDLNKEEYSFKKKNWQMEAAIREVDLERVRGLMEEKSPHHYDIQKWFALTEGTQRGYESAHKHEKRRRMPDQAVLLGGTLFGARIAYQNFGREGLSHLPLYMIASVGTILSFGTLAQIDDDSRYMVQMNEIHKLLQVFKEHDGYKETLPLAQNSAFKKVLQLGNWDRFERQHPDHYLPALYWKACRKRKELDTCEKNLSILRRTARLGMLLISPLKTFVPALDQLFSDAHPAYSRNVVDRVCKNLEGILEEATSKDNWQQKFRILYRLQELGSEMERSDD